MISSDFTQSCSNFDLYTSTYFSASGSDQTTSGVTFSFTFNDNGDSTDRGDFRFYFEDISSNEVHDGIQRNIQEQTISSNNVNQSQIDDTLDVTSTLFSAASNGSFDDKLAAVSKTLSSTPSIKGAEEPDFTYTYINLDLNKYVSDLLESAPVTSADAVITPAGDIPTHGKRRMRKSLFQTKLLSQEYKLNSNWDKKEISVLSKKTGLTKHQIYKWYWSQKQKKQSEEEPTFW